MAKNRRKDLLSEELRQIPTRDRAYLHIDVGGDIEVEGCRSVLEYNRDCLVLRAGAYTVLFEGSDITIKELTQYHICLGGQIGKVSFGKRE